MSYHDDIQDLLPDDDAMLSRLASRVGKPLNRRAFRYWLSIRGQRAMPLRRDFDPFAIPSVLPSVILLQVLHAEKDFLYRVVGTRWVDHFGRNDAWRRMSQIPHQRPPSAVWEACASVVESRLPLMPEHLPYVGQQFKARDIEVLIMPLSATGELADYLFVTVDFVKDDAVA